MWSTETISPKFTKSRATRSPGHGVGKGRAFWNFAPRAGGITSGRTWMFTSVSRSAEEVEAAMRKCAILKAEKRLIENGWLMEDEREEFEHALAREIEDAFTFARASAFPDEERDLHEIFMVG